MEIYRKTTFYKLSQINIQLGLVLFGTELVIFNPASLSVARTTYNQAVDWEEVQPKQIVDVSMMRDSQKDLRPIVVGKF